MEDAFAPPRNDYRRSQQSRRSATRSGDGYYIESESPSSRRDSRDDGRGKNPYEGEDEQYDKGNEGEFFALSEGDNYEHQIRESDNDEEEDDAFNPEGGRHEHNTRSTRQAAYNVLPRGQQQPITPNARVLQPTAFVLPPTPPPAASTQGNSGLDEMLAREGVHHKKMKTMAELKWQAAIAKDKDKIEKFLENVLQVRGFHAFLFMTKDSCFVRMAHSVAKFATVNPIAGEVGGIFFAFIGDR
jgi:hypothetical protein